MKQILPILMLALSFLSFNNARAQFVVNVIAVDCSGPGVCDGYAMIDSSNTMNFTSVLWYMNGNLIQNGGNATTTFAPEHILSMQWVVVLPSLLRLQLARAQQIRVQGLV